MILPSVPVWPHHDSKGNACCRWDTGDSAPCRLRWSPDRTPNKSDSEQHKPGAKRDGEQHLLLRGSRGFVSLEDYDRFVVGVLWVANAKRQKRLAQELASMRPLPVGRLAEYKEYAPVVSPQSLIRVKRCMYSVPSRLIGLTLRVELHEVQLKKPKRMSRSSVGGSLSFSAR